MKIAIIGTGISGLTAAYLLQRKHEITVFEAADRLGGHTATIDVKVQGQHYAVDTGFIVYNDRSYPNFIKLMQQLDVLSQPTEMSFSVSCAQRGLEYSGSNLNTLFAQRSNLVSPYFLRMVRDIMRFNKQSQLDLERGDLTPDMTLGEYLDSNGYSEGFKRHYLVPMTAAIWSSGTAAVMAFPLVFFVQFFKNHGLLSIKDRPQWRSIVGGSRQYIEPLTRSFVDRIRLSCAVTSVSRSAQGVIVRSEQYGEEVFDQVVMATHSDQALKLLQATEPSETEILEAIAYQDNDVVLHTDESILPRSRRTWSSWNYLLDNYQQDQAVLTYNMNILQRIEAPVTFCVTLNNTRAIDATKILGQYNYSHPVFTVDGIAAQERLRSINGSGGIWFCGAWCRNGFHEDGVASALAVTEKLGLTLS
jgi:predicted NAD/FAD-binding protein